jgi:hypothetical protein
MLFLRASRVIDMIIEGRLSDKYVFNSLSLIILLMVISSLYPSSEGYPKIISSLTFLCICLISMYSCFKVNESIDNQNFLNRFIAFTLPLMSQTFLIFISGSFMYHTAKAFINGVEVIELFVQSESELLVINSMFWIFFFSMMVRSFLRLKKCMLS